MTFLWLVSQFSNLISGSVSSFEYRSYLKSTLNGFLQIQIINSSLKIFPPLPGANKCQYNKQYVTQQVNQGIQTLHFLQAFPTFYTFVLTQRKVRSCGTQSRRVYTVSTTHHKGSASYREDMVRR